MKLHPDDIHGSGGGGKGAGEGGKEASNTLRSNARARLLELISEGEVESVLVGGGKGIFFDQTPIINENNSVNFKGIKWESRSGLPDQPHFLGNASAETPFSVETRVKFDTGPVVRSISEQNATAVRVVVRVPALVDSDNDKGNINPSSVSWVIEVRPNLGTWAVAATVSLNNQKCTSTYERATRVTLPEGGYPWDIRVRRLSPDSTNVKIQNETWFASYTTIVEGKFTYPHCAMVWLDVNASLFNQGSIPSRYFHVKGLKINVPTNYNPVTRVYTGIWNGTFKIAYTNNPAWVLYDLLVNDRYGIGEFVDATKVDKWSLYQIAQYCDQLVPNGFGAEEPRYTFNAQLNSRDDAFKVLQVITTAFRGMAYWSLGQVFAVPDAPSDPVKLVTPANVIDGTFTYSGTSLKARHSVATVTWNDPQDFYRPAKEVVVNEATLRQYGWRETSVQATGCTSRGLAHRYGKWILDTEQYATETVEYGASWDHADVRPGDIIAIADPRKAQIRTGGRIQETGTTTLVLDRPFERDPAITYSLMIELPDGTVAQRTIQTFSNGDQTVTLASALPSAPVVGAMWIITGSDVAPRQYRVLSITEAEKNIFKINALFHDPTKYARVEQGINLDPIAYTRPKTTILPPSNLDAKEVLYFANGVQASRIELSWTPADDFMARGYKVTAETPNGFVQFPEVQVPSFLIEQVGLGTWTFSVSSVGKDGRTSPPVEVTVEALGWGGVPAPSVADLQIFGRTDNNFIGQNCRITWRNVFHNTTTPDDVVTDSAGGITNPFYLSNEVTVFDALSNTVLRVETVGVNEYTYTYAKNAADTGNNPKRQLRFEVKVKDTLGRTSSAASLLAQNLPPPVIIPTLTAGMEQVFLQYDAPTDLDFRGAKVWVSTTNNFDPLVTTPTYEGPNSALSFPCTPDVPNYVRIAGYDEFGRTGLNISPQQTITSNSIGLDLTPPAVPAGLSLASGTSTNADGSITTTLTATWTMSAESNFGHYQIEIQAGNGSGSNWIGNLTDTNRFSWPVMSNTLYAVRLRAATKSGATSAYAATATHTTVAKTTAPGQPTALAATASLKAAYLSWTNPVDADLEHIEIWRGTTNTFGSATLIGRSLGTAFSNVGLTTGQQYFYWVRAMNTSGVVGTVSSSVSVIPGQVAEGDIAANAITADKITAGTITGDKLNVNTALPATITVGVTGVQIGVIESRANDPAARVNAQSTTIDPGKILISGATTLASWRNGTDLTKIEGGSIAANTVSANKIQVGDRNITVAGIEFSYDKATSVLSWTAGTIGYINDLGNYVTFNITAGNVTWVTGTTYVAWQKDTTVLSTSTTAWSPVTYHTLATYQGSNILVANYGRTIIDGDKILTGSIVAAKIAVGAITANELAANAITAVKISAGAVTADKINGGTLNATSAINIGGTNFQLSAPNQNMVVKNAGGTVDLVKIGLISPGVYGIELRDGSNNIVFKSVGNATVDIAADIAVDAADVTGLGAFATLNQINAANASTYIANAGIKDAQIESLSATKISAASLSAITANLGTVTAGTARDAAGKFVINFTDGTLTVSE